MFSVFKRSFHRSTDNILRCRDCRYFDRPLCQDDFRASNRRRCRQDGQFHWLGDEAEKCDMFDFKEADDERRI